MVDLVPLSGANVLTSTSSQSLLASPKVGVIPRHFHYERLSILIRPQSLLEFRMQPFQRLSTIYGCFGPRGTEGGED